MILGLLTEIESCGQPALAEKCRDLTISWARYAYHGAIIEGASVNAILDAAVREGEDDCFILGSGQIIRESWRPFADDGDLVTFLETWAGEHEFLAAGTLLGAAAQQYRLDSRGLLVDLNCYVRLGAPQFDEPTDCRSSTGAVSAEQEGDAIVALRPTGRLPTTTGPPSSGFVHSSLAAGLPVYGLDHKLADALRDLAPTDARNAAALARYLGTGIAGHASDPDRRLLTRDQDEFLGGLARQTCHARNGVFLWNIESYADVESCAQDFPGPTTSLYSVCAGFKPNRILQTHGFTDQTRVVFFDYSDHALNVRKCLLDEWDGRDYPAFVRYLFRTFPSPETYYQLWSDVTPDQVTDSDLDRMWQRELARWGGADTFAEHWQAYRRLEHVFVSCNIMADPQPLLAQVRPEPAAVVWWSNAFFTMYGNWFYRLAERQRSYDTWIRRLASGNPHLFLYGADDQNVSVNGIQAGDYFERLNEADRNYLRPRKFHREVIRS